MPVDVTNIQKALNKAGSTQGGPASPLAIDGICGSQTKNAIQNFQIKHFGWKGADGLIEPGKQTLSKLNSIVGSGLPGAGTGGPEVAFSAPLDPLQAIKVRDAISASTIRVVAALTELNRAIGNPAYTKTSPTIKRNFKIASAPAAEWDFHLRALVKVFSKILEVLRTEGATKKYFVQADYTHTKGELAYCMAGGAFLPNDTFADSEGPPGAMLSTRVIYICKAFFKCSPDRQAMTIIHELAHHCSSLASLVIDVAYDSDQAALAALSYVDAMGNAESYALFACEQFF